MNHDEARIWFGAYIAAFNRCDCAAYSDYYTDDVQLVIGSGKVLQGRQAIVDFYRGVNATTQRTIAVIQLIADEHGLAAELESEFLATQDAADFPSGPLRKGDRLHIRSFAFYELRGGKFSRIRAATFHRELRPAAMDEFRVG
jgi:ketosteroid isomerase-like protein